MASRSIKPSASLLLPFNTFVAYVKPLTLRNGPHMMRAMTTTITRATADSVARAHALDALKVIHDVMADPKLKAADRLRAAEMMLDRGYGKPTAAVIQVPAGRALSARLAAMSDDALLALMQKTEGEGTPQTGGPTGDPGPAAVPTAGTFRPGQLALGYAHDIVDAEYTEIAEGEGTNSSQDPNSDAQEETNPWD